MNVAETLSLGVGDHFHSQEMCGVIRNFPKNMSNICEYAVRTVHLINKINLKTTPNQ